jgi:hypothetical protein
MRREECHLALSQSTTCQDTPVSATKRLHVIQGGLLRGFTAQCMRALLEYPPVPKG